MAYSAEAQTARRKIGCHHRWPPVLLEAPFPHPSGGEANTSAVPDGGHGLSDSAEACSTRRLVAPQLLEDADAVALSLQLQSVAANNDVGQLAQALTRQVLDADGPLVKARAIFRWVAAYILFGAAAIQIPRFLTADS